MQRALGEPLAAGRTAEIYAWEPGWVLKLFFDWVPDDLVEHEARVARCVHAAGVATPAVGELLAVDGRRGLLYQRVDGPLLGACMAQRPWLIWRFSVLLADLHVAMHSATEVAGLPDQRDMLASRIRQAPGLSDRERRVALDQLARMPGGEAVCHGDFHPWNVILSPEGAVVLDWPAAHRGRALADVARTSLLLLGVRHMSEGVSRFDGLGAALCQAIYIRRYHAQRPFDWQAYRTWYWVLAAARLSERIPGQDAWLKGLVAQGVGDTFARR